jgi:hypothetical protein
LVDVSVERDGNENENVRSGIKKLHSIQGGAGQEGQYKTPLSFSREGRSRQASRRRVLECLDTDAAFGQ